MKVMWAAAALAACASGSPDGKGADPSTGVDSDPPEPPGCEAPTLTAPLGRGEVVWVPQTAAGAPPGLSGRRLTLSGSGPLTLTLEGDGEVRHTDGSPLELPATFEAPQSFVVTFAGPGAGQIAAANACGASTLAVRSSPVTDLVAQPIPAAPGVWFRDTQRQDEPISIAIDPARAPDRVGMPYDVYVVAHRSPDAWLADPKLVDVTDDIEHGVVAAGSAAENLLQVWSRARGGPRLTSAWDVVVDFGADGRLDPGDLIDGLGARPGLWTTPDLAAPGRYTPMSGRFNDGNFLVQEIWYPNEIDTFTQPVPIVILSHGNGHDYRWYDHLGRHFSSWGYVFMSHANNTAPGPETASSTTLKNTDHFLETYATRFNGVLAGHLDEHAIAWIGHSRGGEGVVRAYDRLYDHEYTPDHFSLADIRVISSIAPTVFLPATRSDPHDVFYHQLLGSSDGDVTGGVDCAICQSLVLANLARGPVATTYIHGAWHNAFHNGGGWNDGVGPDQLPIEEVHAIEKATLLALLGWRLQGLDGLAGWFSTSPDAARPMGTPDDAIIAATWRDAPTDDILILDAFQLNPEPELNDLGGAVSWTVGGVTEALLNDRNALLTWNEADPMNGMTAVDISGYERGVTFDWTGDSSYTTRVPPGSRDWRRWDVLSMRVAQGSRHPNTVAHGGPLGFVVELVDGAEQATRVDIAPYGLVTEPYLRGGLGDGLGWQGEMNTVRVPLRAFTGVDLSDVRAVRLVFGTETGAATGRVVLDDLYLGRN